MYISKYFNILYLKKAYYIVFMVNTLIDRSVLYSIYYIIYIYYTPNGALLENFGARGAGRKSLQLM